jgi:hypothetical protein
MIHGLQLQSDKHLFCVRQITNHSANRLWQGTHKRWDGNDLISFSQLRLLMDINHFNMVLIVKVYFADFF